LAQYQVGFQTTIYDWSKTNWVLKADPTWNTFATNLPVGPNGMTIRVNSQGLFDVVDPTSGTSTSTSVTSSASSSVFGQAVTFTAVVNPTTPVAGTPTGPVTFRDGNNILGTGTLDSTGTATFSTSALGVGTHTITASYGGDSTFATSSTQTSQRVSQLTTAVALNSPGSPSVFSQLVTFTAIVSANAPGSGIPTGTVTFLDGSTALGTGTLDSTGKATFSTSALGVGSHTITATFGGDANSAASSSGQITQGVTQAPTITTAVSSASPSLLGQLVTFTATVNGNFSVTPSGVVTFFDGSTALGSGTLDSAGKAVFSTSALSTGSHTITVSYAGSVSFSTSSAQITQTVSQSQATSTTLTSSANPSVFGQSVTFTATVSAGGSLVTSGAVTFLDGSTLLGTGSLNSSGVAKFSTSILVAGNHTITATYGGSTAFAASVGQLTQAVNLASTSASVTSASTSVYGQLVTIAATITTMAPGSGIPTGTVTFLDGSTVLGTGTVNSSGKATFSTSTLTAGKHKISVSYGGSADSAVSTASMTQTVKQPATTTTVTSSASKSVYGQAVTFTARVSSSWAVATGSVVFMNGKTILGKVTLDSTGRATLTTAALGIGSHTITVSYAATTNFGGSSSSMTQTVNKASTLATLTSSAATSVFGQSVTFTVVVTSVAPGTGIPTGKVTFMNGSTVLGTVVLDATGKATFTTSALSIGSHSISVSYAGNANDAASTGILSQLTTAS
jgi:hypothetical protein